jgi:hypothetical protein
MKRERMTNPKCQTRPGFDTFSAKSADLTGLKMRRITRADFMPDMGVSRPVRWVFRILSLARRHPQVLGRP